MILLDDRTGSKELLEPIKRKGAEVEVVRLPFGDAAFMGQGPDGTVIPVGVEVKAIGDMLRVISDGRFEGYQLPGMMSAYLERYLIIEGPTKCKDGNLQVRRGPVWAPVTWGRRVWRCGDVGRWLTRMEIVGGLHVRRTWTRDDTAQTIVDLHDWFSKEFEEHGGQRQYDRPTDGSLMPINLAGRMAKEIEGFGWTKGRAAGRVFKSPLRMVNASRAEWMEIQGVGYKLADRAYDAMRKEEP